MPPIPASEFARRFRRLSAGERRRFIAALWTARGHETTVTDGLVRAVSGGETNVIAVAGLLSRPPATADVVVGTRELSRLRGRAKAIDAEYLSPRDLRDLLCFGVERATGARLAEEHLGIALWRASSSDADGGSVLRRAGVAGAVLAVAVTLFAVSGIGVPLVDGGDEASFETPAASDGTETAGGEAGAASVGATPDPPETLPPGLDADGVENASLLVSIHRERIGENERRATVEYEGPTEDPLLRGVARHEATMAVHTEWRYRLSAASYDAENATEPSFASEEWGDGHQVHRLVNGSGQNRSYSARPRGEYGTVAAYESFVIDRLWEALTTERAHVSTMSANENALVAVTATGHPPGFGPNATDYRAQAVFTPEGRLVRLTVEYEHVPTGEPVRFAVRYRDVDDVPPPPQPDWVLDPAWD